MNLHRQCRALLRTSEVTSAVFSREFSSLHHAGRPGPFGNCVCAAHLFWQNPEAANVAYSIHRKRLNSSWPKETDFLVRKGPSSCSVQIHMLYAPMQTIPLLDPNCKMVDGGVDGQTGREGTACFSISCLFTRLTLRKCSWHSEYACPSPRPASSQHFAFFFLNHLRTGCKQTIT